MKSALTLGLTSALLFSTSSYALDPIQGFYGGVFLGGNYTSPIKFNFTEKTSNTVLINGDLAYSMYGNGGGEIGYRMNQFRVETELFYNHSPYSSVTINGHRFKTRKTGSGFRFKGQTNTAALMVNGIFDAFFVGEDSDFVPYLGLGLGYARIQNSVKFFCNNVDVGTGSISINKDKSCTLTPNPNGPDSNLKSTASAGAAQAILGISYYMDDYTLFSFDVREFATRNVKQFNSKVQFTTFNIGFIGSFDYG